QSFTEDRRSVPADAAGHDGDVRDNLPALLSHWTHPTAAAARTSGCRSTSACSHTSSSSSSPYCSSSYHSDTGDHVLDVPTLWVCRSSALFTTASDHPLSGLTVSSSVGRPPYLTSGSTFRGRSSRGVPASTVDAAGGLSSHLFRF